MRRIKWMNFALLAVIATSVAARAQDEASDEAATPAEQYAALAHEYSEAQAAFQTRLREAESSEERQAVYNEYFPNADEYAGRFLSLAEEHPDTDAAVKSLVWIAQNVRMGEPLEKALAALAENHAGHPDVAAISSSLARSNALVAETLLRAILEENEDPVARQNASFALASLMKNWLNMANYVKTSPDTAASLRNAFGDEYVERVSSLDAETVNAEVEALLEQVVEAEGGNEALVEQAERELFEVRHLSIGKVAPDIEGEDVDGVPFKLSDYRGKVVVLDFWGDW